MAIRFACNSVILFALASWLAQPGTPLPDQASPQTLDQPYCGIYSAYAAARILGKEVEFSELLRPEYVSHRGGSTAEDLIEACRSLGLSAAHRSGLTRLDLAMLDGPMILHIRASPAARVPQHWVLLARHSAGGTVLLVDGSNGLVRRDLHDIVALWDGDAVLVRTAETGISSILPSRVASFFGAGLVLLAALFLPRLAPSWRWWRLPILRASAFLGALAGTALLIAAIDAGGILRQAEMREAVVDRNIGKFLPAVLGRQQLERALQDRSVVIIDARVPRDYALGHLPGALNVPVYVSPEAAAQVLADVAHDRPLLLYCQSVDCTYSERLAITLRRLGYRDMTIYTGGYNDWIASAAK